MTATADATCAAVDDLLRERLSLLADDWHDLAGRRADVLGDLDLPALAAHASRGGKRFRPLMVHWGWAAAGAHADRFDEVVRLGAALEMLHVFALVHDDVMDRSELRRGAPSVHSLAREAHREEAAAGPAEAFGDHIAILVGDLLHMEADDLVAGLPAPVRGLWRTMMLELVLGQRRDLTGAAAGRRDLDHALEVARLKSGSYTVQRPLQMGAVIGGGEAPVVDALLAYGGHLGEAFGLRDDMLGTWGDPSLTGKSREDDLQTRKPTVLLALAAERVGDQARELLSADTDEPLTDEQLDLLRTELDASGIRIAVERIIAEEVTAAVDALDPEVVHPEAVDGLTALAHRIAWRNS